MMTRTDSAQFSIPGADRAHGTPRFRAPYFPAQIVVHGTAFALMCLWMRTSPGALRRRLGSDSGFESTLGA